MRIDRFADVSLNQWPVLTPADLAREHLDPGEAMTGAPDAAKRPVVR